MYNIPIDKIPQKGYLLAYFRNAVLFEPYEVTEDHSQEGKTFVCEQLAKHSGDELMECHLFSRDTEYRAIYRESRYDWIETVLNKGQEESMDPDLIYSQTVMVKNEYAERALMPKRLVIVNRYEYSANDTLVLKNYRISY